MYRIYVFARHGREVAGDFALEVESQEWEETSFVGQYSSVNNVFNDVALGKGVLNRHCIVIAMDSLSQRSLRGIDAIRDFASNRGGDIDVLIVSGNGIEVDALEELIDREYETRVWIIDIDSMIQAIKGARSLPDAIMGASFNR